jgi:hypothetical protein
MGFFSSAADLGLSLASPTYAGYKVASKKLTPTPFSPSADVMKPHQWQTITGDIPLPKEVGPANPIISAAKNPEAYKAQAITGPLAEYDYMRNKLNSQVSQQRDEAQDALKRRFAALGGLNTGAYIKQAQIADEKLNQQKEESLGNIGFQEAQQRRALEREEAQKEFQSGEAFKQREFGASEQDRAREYQTELFNKDLEFKNNVAQFDARSKLKQLDIDYNKVLIDERNAQFNKELSVYEARHKGGLFGGGGFLGLGL